MNTTHPILSAEHIKGPRPQWADHRPAYRAPTMKEPTLEDILNIASFEFNEEGELIQTSLKADFIGDHIGDHIGYHYGFHHGDHEGLHEGRHLGDHEGDHIGDHIGDHEGAHIIL